MAPSMDEMGLGKGSFDHGDPTTTNLYVGNLAPTVTEEALEVGELVTCGSSPTFNTNARLYRSYSYMCGPWDC